MMRLSKVLRPMRKLDSKEEKIIRDQSQNLIHWRGKSKTMKSDSNNNQTSKGSKRRNIMKN